MSCHLQASARGWRFYNAGMRWTLKALLVLVACLAGCSPTLNWRDLGFEGSRLQVQLPCKPDRTTRSVQMGSVTLDLQVAGCEAGDAMLAVMTAALPAGTDVNALLQGWQQATLAHARAQVDRQEPWHAPGLLALPGAQRITARAKQPDGRPVQMQAVWGAFHENGQLRLLHAVVYSAKGAAEPAQTFFESVRP